MIEGKTRDIAASKAGFGNAKTYRQAKAVVNQGAPVRAELTPAERATYTAKRKAIYEELHPEARLGENQHTRVRQLGEPTSDRFTTDTATKTGKSERARIGSPQPSAWAGRR